MLRDGGNAGPCSGGHHHPGGDLVHCTSCEWSVEEGVLHVLVEYDHHVYTPREQELMETLDLEMEG